MQHMKIEKTTQNTGMMEMNGLIVAPLHCSDAVFIPFFPFFLAFSSPDYFPVSFPLIFTPSTRKTPNRESFFVTEKITNNGQVQRKKGRNQTKRNKAKWSIKICTITAVLILVFLHNFSCLFIFWKSRCEICNVQFCTKWSRK